MREFKRRLKLLDNMSSELDAILIINEGRSMGEGVADANFFYLTNSDVTGIFLHNFNEPRIVTNIMEEKRAKKSWVKKVDVGKADEIMKFLKNKKIGIDASSMSAKIYDRIGKDVKTTDISEKLMEIRSVKTKYEINIIKKAAVLTKKIGEKIESEISTKITETQLKSAINTKIVSIGAEQAFTTIVASGKNSSLPHHISENKKITFPVIVDFGIRYGGYCTDVTRTFGSSDENLLEKITEKLETMIKPGAKANELDMAARKMMGAREKYFIHSLGHGLGIEIHETPTISKTSKDMLKAGMFISIEPGIYGKIGIRIENNYLVKENGFEKTSNF